jgi:hypothetical protein
MSDLEAAGALVTAGLAACEIEGDGIKRAGHDKHAAHRHNCANCKTPLYGAFCAACGQAAHVHRSLLHLAEELLHGIFHFDAKGWKTIPLLIAFPGRLTRRYIDGQRKNYVSPLALFLFMVFLSFFVASLTTEAPGDGAAAASPAKRAKARAELVNEIASADKDLAKAEADLAATMRDKADPADANEALSEARSDQAAALRELQKFDKKGAAATTAEKDLIMDGMPEKAHAGTIAKLKGKKFDSKYPVMFGAIKHIVENPELMLYKLKNTIYKFSFMLIPISLPFLWLMFFWRRGVTMYDHAVFVLYSLSFMSLLFVLLAILMHFDLKAPAVGLALLAPPVHMFVQLRGAYSLGILSALWRTAMLLLVAMIVIILFIVFVAAMTMH